MKNNTNFGENTLYVQRIFSIQQRQYTDNQINMGGGVNPSGRSIKVRF
jgi:hypothetical protein